MGTMYRIDGDLLDDIADAINTAKARPNTVTVENLSVTENDTYTAPSGKAYGQVTVNVPGVTIVEKTGSSNQWFEGFTNSEVLEAVRSGNGTLYGDFTFELGNTIVIRAYASADVSYNNKLTLSYISIDESTKNYIWEFEAYIKPALGTKFTSGISIRKYLGTDVAPTSSKFTFVYHPHPSSE